VSIEASRNIMLDRWNIKDCAPGEGTCSGMSADQAGWVPVAAPGDTYLALHAAGRIPHPFTDGGEAACAWVAEREWWWRTSFRAETPRDDERLSLCFEGLDTYATVWLNGEELGTSDNMFAAARFDVTRRVCAAQDNVLLIRFSPPSRIAADKPPLAWDLTADPIRESKRNYHRKAQFGWGWDWGPWLPTVGIWRPARLELRRAAAIEDVSFSTVSLGPAARVRIDVAVDAFHLAGEALRAAVTLQAPDCAVAASAELAFASGKTHASVELDVDAPQLWWTPELGAPDLYTLRVALFEEEQPLDHKVLEVGIRRIELDTSPDPDEPGCSFFRFVLNGVPIFARGANWIPASSFVGALTAADYQALLQSAADANLNMLRVWGGGIYEADAFYHACDRLGLLVWQDFMFACTPYPENEPGLLDNISREVDQQIIRLRNHPCLSLWCGENEGQAVHQYLDLMAGQSTPFLGATIFQKLIPQALERLDPTTAYWPGSPYGGPMHNSMRAGDVHNWTVWHGVPPVPDNVPVPGRESGPENVAYTRYAEDRARFVSEFGIQAAPSRDTLSRWLAPDQMKLDSAGFLSRIKDHPKDKVNAMLLPVTGLPGDLDRYIEYTQLVQAEGLKFGIEHYRRRKPHCSGTLIWQYNDCWPGISWSLIDHDRVRKAAWFYVARAYAPVLGSFKAMDDGAVELWITNDTAGAKDIEADLSLMTFSGEVVWRDQLRAVAPAGSSVVAWRGRVAPADAAPGRVLLVRSAQFPANRLLFAPFKDLPLGAGEPQMHIQANGDGSLAVTLTGSVYHHFIHLVSDLSGVIFSDNYFDLHHGETRTVRAVKPGRMLKAADLELVSFHPARHNQG